METKLNQLGLPENVVNEILDIFDTHQLTLKQYSKPKGKMQFRDNLQEIESISKALEKKLSKLTRMERQIIEWECPNLYGLRSHLSRLNASCCKAKGREVRFSRREPFLLNLTSELWELLERNGIPVTIYKNGILSKVLDAFFEDKPRRLLKDESDAPDDLRSFHLVREAARRKS